MANWYDKYALREAPSAPKSQCVRCTQFRPALDPQIQKAYLGKCRAWENPFSIMVPLTGFTDCKRFADSGEVVTVGAQVAQAAATGKKTATRRYEFYYSSKVTPGQQYPADVQHALHLAKQLQSKGVDIKIVDIASVKDVFPIYHRSVTGPDASVRAVFGTKGALEEDFGRAVPAFFVLQGEDRYPVEVYPRMGETGVIGVEEALQKTATAPPSAEAVAAKAQLMEDEEH